MLGLAIVTALTGSPAQAAFPGTNGRIACEGTRGDQTDAEIFAVNPDGAEETLLTNNTVRDGDPVYSPDGTKVAFESQRNSSPGVSNSEIYVANNDGDLEGPDVKRLTFNAGTVVIPGLNEVIGGTGGVSATDRSPSWSPDGSEIVFHSGRAATFPDGTTVNDTEIYKMSAATGEEGGLQRLTTSKGQDAVPSWSPDGTKIAFQSLRESTASTSQNLEIFTMNPDGSAVTNISNNPGTPNDPATTADENSNGIDSFPTAWSPDSKQIAFGSTRANATPGNQNFEIYKMNRDGSNPVRLTANRSGDTPGNSGDYDHAPAWSPDGKRIVFSSGRGSTAAQDVFNAYTMDADAGEAAGLQRLAATSIFGRCDWQSISAAGATPPVLDPLPRGPVSDCAAVSILRGGTGANRITGTLGADRIFAGAGNDTVDGRAGNDCIDLGPGADRGKGGLGDDLLLGGPGSDLLNGNRGTDRLRGGAGGDRLVGGSGGGLVSGGRGRDRLRGGAGKDVISAGSSDDRAVGGAGDDRIGGNAGGDVLKGNSGKDRIAGGAGNDRISGGAGGDRISGGSGRDRIAARDHARDRITCGKGRDRVIADRLDRVSRSCEHVRRGR